MQEQSATEIVSNIRLGKRNDESIEHKKMSRQQLKYSMEDSLARLKA